MSDDCGEFHLPWWGWAIVIVATLIGIWGVSMLVIQGVNP